MISYVEQSDENIFLINYKFSSLNINLVQHPRYGEINHSK